MQIWSAEIKELETLYTSIKGRFPVLEKELEQLIKFEDANVILLYSRRCLEVIITDLCEHELKRPRKTEPLKGIIDKLHHEEKIPSHIIASMQNLNTLSTFGAHPKEFDPEQVKPVLNNLTTIIKWYLKYKDTQAISKPKPEEVRDEIKTTDDSTEQQKKPKKKMILLLSGLALVVVIVVVVLFIFDIIGGGKRIEELEKSIAVLPFKLLSDEPDKQYLADGMMDAILLHLSKIEDLRVLARTSVEQYRETDKTATMICKELDVAYVLEGSFQKYGNQVRLIVQLIQPGREGHAWAREYDREWKDILFVQSEVAQTVAKELKAAITPEEKQLIEKTPTSSLTALDFFQRGREENWKYWMDNDNREALERAEDLYLEALKYDSTFAQAYTGLAMVYWNKHYWETYFSDEFVDSFLILTNIALSYDNQLSEAYTWKGVYYSEIGKPEQAIEELDKATKYNPNDWLAYWHKGSLYMYNDLVKSIDNSQKAAILNRGAQLPDILRWIGSLYNFSGFTEKGKNYRLEAFKLDGDSAEYYKSLGGLEFLLKGYAIDSNDINILYNLGNNYMSLGQHKESLKYYKKYIERLKTLGNLSINNMHRIGWAYWQNGHKEEAEKYFDMQVEYCNGVIELGRSYAQNLYPYYDLAGVYAFHGEKDKAYENLRIFNQRKIEHLWMVTLIKNDPLFDSIRDEEEFQKIVRDVEAKYQAEHERVRKWLEEQGDLPG